MRSNPHVEHAEHRTSDSFGEVVRRFEGAVGSIENGGLDALLDAATMAEYKAAVHAQEGASGFMRFLTVDHGAGLMHSGIDAQCRQYTIGNPVLAWSMVEHDLGAALYVPLQLVIYEDASAAETVLAYNLPSSLMALFANDELLAAAKVLDEKLVALGVLATGVQP